jgi:hypothetical protein
LRICLSDKYPNLEAFEKAKAASAGRIGFYPQAVDATSVPREIKGIRTMFSTFHHFLPQQARAILQDAVDAREGIGLFEAARRSRYDRAGVCFCFCDFCLHTLDSSVSLVAAVLDLFDSGHSFRFAVRWSGVLLTKLQAAGIAGVGRRTQCRGISLGDRRAFDWHVADHVSRRVSNAIGKGVRLEHIRPHNNKPCRAKSGNGEALTSPIHSSIATYVE